MARFDDDDEDADRPRRPVRRPAPAPRSNGAVIVAVVIALGILSVGCLGAVVGGFFLFWAKDEDRGGQVAVNDPPAAAPVPQAHPADPAPTPANPVIEPQAFPMNPAVQPPGPPPALPPKELAAITIPQAQPRGGTLFGPATAEGGATWRKVSAAGDTPARGDTFAGAAWGDGGKVGFVLTRAGVLTRFRHPGLEPDLEVDFDQPCDGLAVSRQGLIVTLGSLQELWVVDPSTLGLSRRAGVSRVEKALTSPALDAVYAVCDGARVVARLGLSDGRLTPSAVGRSPTARVGTPDPGGSFPYAAIAPDGRFLYAEVPPEALGRYRVDGDQLLLEESSDRIAPGHRAGIFPSPDGRYVCFPSGGGNAGAGNYGTSIFRTENLRRPAFAIHNDAYPEVVGFDPAGQRVYSQNYDTPLLVFDETGTRRAALKLGGVSGSHNIREYVPHPDGRSLLVRAAHTVVSVGLAR